MEHSGIEQRASSVSVSDLRAEIASSDPPIVIDVRRREAFANSTQMLSGALRRDPDEIASWLPSLPTAGSFVPYCVHGAEVSGRVTTLLNEAGIVARRLEGGLEAWVASGGAIDGKPRGAATRWVTRERPKVDRIACPWLVARFVDPDAEFLYVAAAEVLDAARKRDAAPYDVPDVHFSHDGARCSFDAFLAHYRLRDPALARLAVIVRGADTGRPELAPQSPGLVAISLGLSRNFADDHQMLAHGMVMYDALYAWCSSGQDARHTWSPPAHRSAVTAAQ